MNEKDMQHGQYWTGEDLTGWVLTEKYNGCRAYWDGENMWSRGGLCIDIPESWRNNMEPLHHLDGEIYYGVDGVYKCGAAVRYGKFIPGMEFFVFDMPKASGSYLERIKLAHDRFKDYQIIKVVSAVVCRSNTHALDLMYKIQAAGGEGLIARHPGIIYSPGRTTRLLKVKEPLEI